MTVAAHRLPASELPVGPRRRRPRGEGSATRVLPSVMAVHCGGQARADSTEGRAIMTQDKARKSAIRRRMAETGEPYSVASHAVRDLHDETDPGMAAEAAMAADEQAAEAAMAAVEQAAEERAERARRMAAEAREAA